jgi:hypothetical protein
MVAAKSPTASSGCPQQAKNHKCSDSNEEHNKGCDRRHSGGRLERINI